MTPVLPSVGEKQYKFEEILPIYKAVSDETDTGTFADFMEAFKTFDREGQGFVAAAELRHVLTSLGTSSIRHITRTTTSFHVKLHWETSTAFLLFYVSPHVPLL